MKTQTVKKYLMVVLGLILGISSYGQESGEWRIPLSNPGQKGILVVDLRSGSVNVTGGALSEVVVSYSLREKKITGKDKNQTSDGLNRIGGASLDLEASENNNTVKIESNSWSQGVDLNIQVPKNFDLHLETYNNGDLSAKNIIGEVEADNYNGKITLENISGSVVADTYNGGIVVTFDQVKPDTPMAFSTYNGNVDLTFPSDYRASFKMKTKMGEIFEGFDMKIEEAKPKTETKKESGVYKVKIDDWIRGSINGGGPEISMKTTNGDIYVRKK